MCKGMLMPTRHLGTLAIYAVSINAVACIVCSICVCYCRYQIKLATSSHPWWASLSTARLSRLPRASSTVDRAAFVGDLRGSRLKPTTFQLRQQIPSQLHWLGATYGPYKVHAATPQSRGPQGSGKVQLFVCNASSEVEGGSKRLLMAVKACTSELLVCAVADWQA